MLIVKVFVNKKQIDEIHVLNTGQMTVSGASEYTIMKPKGCDQVSIFHKREEGYKPLLKRVLDFIIWKDKCEEDEKNKR